MSDPWNPEKLTDALESAGREWSAYSGRGMMGAQCISTNLDDASDLFRLGQELEGFPSPKVDSMGLGIVAYWPRFKILDDAA